MKIELLPPQEGELMTVADRAYESAKELTIDSPDMAQAAAEELRSIARRRDELDAWRKRITKPLDEAKAAVMDLFRRPLERLGEAEATLKQSLLGWNNEQARLRALEDQRRREAAAAERKRLEEEAAAAAKVAADLAAEAARTGDAQKAAEAEQATVAAENQQMMAELVVAPAPSIEAPKVAGTSVRTTPEPEVVDKMALLAHVAAVPTLAGLFDVNMVALRGMAKTLGVGSIALPGVVIRAKQTVSTSRR